MINGEWLIDRCGKDLLVGNKRNVEGGMLVKIEETIPTLSHNSSGRSEIEWFQAF